MLGRVLAITSDHSYKETVLNLTQKRNLFNVDYTTTIHQAMKMVRENDYSLIIVRFEMVEDIFNLSILKSLVDMPVLVFSYEEPKNNIEAYKLGADIAITAPYKFDYIVETSESLALLYEKTKNGVKKEIPTPIIYGHICIVVETRKVFIKGKKIKLNRKEFDVLNFLMENPEQVFSYSQIYNHVWGEEYEDNMKEPLRCQICSLRKKLQTEPQIPNFIKTFHGVGYSFDPHYDTH